MIIKQGMRHSKTTQALLGSIEQFRKSKKQIEEHLRENIVRNNSDFQHHGRHRASAPQNLFVQERSIEIMSKKLKQKVQSEQQHEQQLKLAEEKALLKKRQIEKRLMEIGKRNQQRALDLKKYDQQVLRKIEEGIRLNEVREKNLKEEYKKLRKSETNTKDVKQYQQKQARKQWVQLRDQKWRLEGLVKQLDQKETKLVADKNPVPLRKQANDKEGAHKDAGHDAKKQKLGMKELGDRYMHQAKSINRDHITKKTKKNLMNLQTKVVGYGSQMMEKIGRNTADLSDIKQYLVQKAAEQPIISLPQISRQPSNSQKNSPPSSPNPEVESRVEQKAKPRSIINFKEDAETRRYLSQIRDNLEEIERFEIDKASSAKKDGLKASAGVSLT